MIKMVQIKDKLDFRTVRYSLDKMSTENISTTGMKIVTCNFPAKWVLFMNKKIQSGKYPLKK
jgi:hypothetical protein